MKSSRHLRTGSKVALAYDIETESGGFWYAGTEGVVDAVYRKDGTERIYVKVEGTLLVLDKSVLDNL